jgi:hypothetical protein
MRHDKMREFGDTPKKGWLERLSDFLSDVLFWSDVNEQGFRGHYERLEKRKRKTKFNRWRRQLINS